jgi:hypothetical protein
MESNSFKCLSGSKTPTPPSSYPTKPPDSTDNTKGIFSDPRNGTRVKRSKLSQDGFGDGYNVICCDGDETVSLEVSRPIVTKGRVMFTTRLTYKRRSMPKRWVDRIRFIE